ncbi:MAG: hypothetical protein HXX18_04435 [Bacteroidetes bacterium]|nr:hypothetical protein [Bacteroidota bacterium]
MIKMSSKYLFFPRYKRVLQAIMSEKHREKYCIACKYAISDCKWVLLYSIIPHIQQEMGIASLHYLPFLTVNKHCSSPLYTISNWKWLLSNSTIPRFQLETGITPLSYLFNPKN